MPLHPFNQAQRMKVRDTLNADKDLSKLLAQIEAKRAKRRKLDEEVAALGQRYALLRAEKTAKLADVILKK